MICALCGFPSDILVPCKCGDVYCSTCRELHECETVAEPPLWPHQEKALQEVIRLIESGVQRICLAIPTGGGKTRCAKEVTLYGLSRRWKNLIYTHKKLLTTQMSSDLNGYGVSHGMLAAGHRTAFLRDVQVASIWTIQSRVYERQSWKFPEADLVIIDECHGNTHDTAKKIIKDHCDRGAVILGLTATPVDLGGLYDELVIGGTNSQLRKCGAHIPCHTFAPDEPDLRKVKRNADGEYVLDELVKRILVADDGTKLPRIFGSVAKNLKLHNPSLKPTVLFGPDVPSSRWFSDYLSGHGISAAHIDAETPDDERQRIIKGVKSGEIKVLCNRFVMREGVNIPELYCCVMATAFGSISSYLQAGGRLLRSHPSLDHVILLDHGGNWHAHGSLNEDREWQLGDTDKSIEKAKRQRQAENPDAEPEPICCPKCQGIRRSGSKCPFCGYEHKKSVRAVVQVDGTLKLMRGPVNKPKRKKSDEEKLWSQYLFQGLYSGQTFNQVAGRFRKTLGYYPPQGLPHMPKENSIHWDLKVRDVCPYLMKRRSVKK